MRRDFMAFQMGAVAELRVAHGTDKLPLIVVGQQMLLQESAQIAFVIAMVSRANVGYFSHRRLVGFSVMQIGSRETIGLVSHGKTPKAVRKVASDVEPVILGAC